MTRRPAATLLAAIGVGLVASPAFAYQADPPPPPPAAEPVRIPVRVIETLADRFGAIVGEQAQVSTGTDDDTLTLRVGLPTGASQENSFSLIASTPLHGNAESLPASLDALANGSRVTLRWGHFGLGDIDPDAVAEGIADRAVAACEHAEPTQTQRCNTNYAVRTYARSEYRRYLWHTIPAGATDFGIDATVGINDFEWLDPVTFVPQQAQHTDWSVAAHGAKYFAGTAITGSISYQRAYEAAKEQQLCRPNPPNPAPDCVTGRGAAPSINENFLLTVGFRHRFMADGTLLNLAVAPEVTYDVIDDVWGVDVPIYVIPGPNGGLNGGVRVGYRSDRDDEFSIGIFLGTTFNLLGG